MSTGLRSSASVASWQVNGMGGARTYGFNIRPIAGSTARFTGIGGAQLLEADETRLTIRFISADNRTRDCYAGE
jgi:hypothetical protein